MLRKNAGNLYQWLIEPLNSQIQESSDIDNLVFVLDGALRNIPMAALYDEQNQEYLVEKDYALSLLPTSQLFNLSSTAAGDNRATLGLAGLAIRAGANTTLASLWRISDQYTIPLITRFYENLNQGLTKAEALHQAQKSLVYQEIDRQKYLNQPYDWGAYVLVGNWQ